MIEFLLFVAFVMLFGIIGSRMAVARGRTEGAGFAIGALLGPLGLVVLAFFRTVASTVQPTVLPPASPQQSDLLKSYRARRDATTGYRGGLNGKFRSS